MKLFSSVSALTALLLVASSVVAETRTATVTVPRASLQIYTTGPHRGVVWADGLGRVYADCRDPTDTRNINYACSGQINPKLQPNEIIVSSSITGLTLTTEVKTCPDAADVGAPPFNNQQCVSGCPAGQYRRVGSDNTCYPVAFYVYAPIAGISKKSAFPIAADAKKIAPRVGCDLFEIKRATVANGGTTLVSANLTSTPDTGCSVVLELSKPTQVQQATTFVIEVGNKGVAKTNTLTTNLMVPVL